MYKIFIVLIAILCLGCNSSKAVSQEAVKPDILILKETMHDSVYIPRMGYIRVSIFVDPETNIEYFIVGNEKGVAITPRLKR